ncbi:MCE family protein [Gordonia sp. ABSL1-1]|uniref:MCE family protein n=1 Tax=Gordonia sp. ABSL1-1 TaxID=3053923 RepID=UPI002573B738|nr:MCE family protein [Gordonia sp. ABSL1-1]MDL9938222.1 MCE family protein [Gordonia sp. ABSL1-1]
MSIMLPGNPVSRASYMVRAVIAIALIGTFAIWMVARSTGVLESNPQVHADVPVEAGLITTGAPVRYHGVKVGEIASIDAGTESSQVNLTIGDDFIGDIPSTVQMRVLPRTFFGDIYVQLVDPAGGAQSSSSLSDGDAITIDSGPEALNLYNIFAKLSDVLAEVQPQKMTVALAAVSRAIGDRGGDLGIMIDDWYQASLVLEDTMNQFIDATPRFRAVVESLKRAAPAITDTIKSTTSISRGIVEQQENLGAFLASASGFVGSVSPFIARQRNNLITIVKSTGKILSTVASNPSGVTNTVTEAAKFGQAGTILFASGRFNITAVPTFSQPMPYTAADCPVYGTMRGQQCNGHGTGMGTGPVRAPGAPNPSLLSPRQRFLDEQRRNSEHPGRPGYTPSGFSGPSVIDGTAEANSMSELESRLPGREGAATGTPNAATTLMLGPLVRGNEVSVR